MQFHKYDYLLILIVVGAGLKDLDIICNELIQNARTHRGALFFGERVRLGNDRDQIDLYITMGSQKTPNNVSNI